MNKELLKGLTKEQIAKLNSCKGSEEILKLAKEEGFELNDEQLEAVSGGDCSSEVTCPRCGGKAKNLGSSDMGQSYCDCPKCGLVPC